jgi:uncharacterized protein
MKMSDTREIKAPPAAVWEALLNPDVLKECVPGCESMTGSAGEGFEAAVVQKVGPVKARFTGVVKLSDMVVGKTVTISGEGKGGAAGFAKGGAVVTLAEIPGGTSLSYDVEASVGGKIAQLGSRIIDGFAKKMADDFFTRFQEAVEGPAPAEVAEDDSAADASNTTTQEKKGWLKRLIGG